MVHKVFHAGVATGAESLRGATEIAAKTARGMAKIAARNTDQEDRPRCHAAVRTLAVHEGSTSIASTCAHFLYAVCNIFACYFFSIHKLKRSPTLPGTKTCCAKRFSVHPSRTPRAGAAGRPPAGTRVLAARRRHTKIVRRSRTPAAKGRLSSLPHVCHVSHTRTATVRYVNVRVRAERGVSPCEGLNQYFRVL